MCIKNLKVMMLLKEASVEKVVVIQTSRPSRVSFDKLTACGNLNQGRNDFGNF